MKKSTLRLPKLKTRDELLRTAPELGRFLASGDGDSGSAVGRATSPMTKPRSPGKARAASPRRIGGAVGHRISDDEITEEERVRAELERVKSERAVLLESLGKLRNDAGKSGGELQQEDIKLLRREIEAKKEKLNELRRSTLAMDETLEQLETTSRDCEQLMPQAQESLQGRLAVLTSELSVVDQDILEAEAKHELYKLLEIRTRRDHAASEARMREARALKEGAGDDFTTLSKQMHEMRAAKEDAERDLGGVVAMYDQVKGDWQKKLKDRRKEVRELERRKAEDAQRKAQQVAIAAEKARIEQEKTTKNKCERDAANARLSAVVPELEALEATWGRLHGICGASTAEDLITFWRGLKAKEANMRELVRLAEVRETRAKEEMAGLLAERAEVFDTDTARGARRQQELEQLMGQPALQQQKQQTEQPEAAGEQQETAEVQSSLDLLPGSEQVQQLDDTREDGSFAAAAEGSGQGSESAGALEEAASEAGAADEAASEAGAPEEAASEAGAAVEAASEAGTSQSAEADAIAGPASAAPPAAAASAASPEAAVEYLLREKQLAIAEARRRKAAAKDKFSKLSQVCVAADQGLHLLALRLKAATEMSADANAGSRRFTAAGSRRVTSMNPRRTTGQHQIRRISAQSLMERRASTQLLPAPEDFSPRMHAAGARISDKLFFPELPNTLSDVSSRLGRLMSMVDQLEVAAAAAADVTAASEYQAAEAAAALSADGSSLESSEFSEAVVVAPPSQRAVSNKKLQWADKGDRQPTPRVDGQPAGEEAEEEEEGEGSIEEAAAAAAEGEKSLRKGFRRRTWAGPAWLDAVGAGKPLKAALMRKQAGGRGGPVGSPAAGGSAAALKRIVGYVEDPESGDEGARGPGANPFDMGSEDEMEEQGDMVVDRQYLKHRAHKLTNPRSHGKHSGAASGSNVTSPTIQVDTR